MRNNIDNLFWNLTKTALITTTTAKQNDGLKLTLPAKKSSEDKDAKANLISNLGLLQRIELGIQAKTDKGTFKTTNILTMAQQLTSVWFALYDDNEAFNLK